jgi:cytoskeletal protein RodZ
MTENRIDPATEDAHKDVAGGHPDLKAAREAKGLSLRDIFERTRISVSYLDAIENSHYHLLPQPVYARTFIKNYALALGLDSKMLLEAYEEHLQSINDRRRQEQEAGSVRLKTQRRRQWIAGLLSASLAVMVLALAMAYYSPSEQDAPQAQPSSVVQPSPEAKPSETAPPSASATTEAPAAQEKPDEPMKVASPPREAAPPEAPPPNMDKKPRERVSPEFPPMQTDKTYRLFLEARERVWLRIRRDRNRPEQVILEAGQTLERFAAEAFTLDIGNAGGVDITFQEKPLGRIGDRGQVVHLRLP